MTMCQNWSTKDDIETIIRTVERFRDEIGKRIFYFLLNEDVTKMGGKTYNIKKLEHDHHEHQAHSDCGKKTLHNGKNMIITWRSM